MTEEYSPGYHTPPNNSKITSHPVKVALAIIATVLLICIMCGIQIIPLFQKTNNIHIIRASDAMIGTELDEDGHILEDIRVISGNVEFIHLEFYFENPTNARVPLDFRWYVGDQLFYSYSSVLENGYVSAFVYRDPNEFQSFPIGNCHVEVWFGNTMILSEPFVIN